MSTGTNWTNVTGYEPTGYTTWDDGATNWDEGSTNVGETIWDATAPATVWTQVS